MSGGMVNAAAGHLAPTSTNGRQLLTNAGTTESESAVLEKGRYATLLVGNEDVCIEFRREVDGSSYVSATTSPLFKANTFYHWFVEENSQFIVVESADGVATHTVWVWTSSPRV
jgi:hypothetical protein